MAAAKKKKKQKTWEMRVEKKFHLINRKAVKLVLQNGNIGMDNIKDITKVVVE